MGGRHLRMVGIHGRVMTHSESRVGFRYAVGDEGIREWDLGVGSITVVRCRRTGRGTQPRRRGNSERQPAEFVTTVNRERCLASLRKPKVRTEILRILPLLDSARI